MDFSVLLSVYRKESPAYFKLALDSIFSQSLLPSEVVIVKDGPLTAELDSIIEEFAYLDVVRVVALPVNSGLGNALREGLKYCSFSLVARMDTDDISKPNRFERQISVFENNPEIDVVGSWIDEFTTGAGITASVSQRRLPENTEELRRFAERRNPINHPTVMFRKEAVVNAGSYQDFPLFEDWYLWVRMMMNGAKFYNVQESLLYFRISLDVYKRRGGFKYAVNEYRLRKEMYRLRFISFFYFIIETPIRFFSRIIPSFIRKYIYAYLLR